MFIPTRSAPEICAPANRLRGSSAASYLQRAIDCRDLYFIESASRTEAKFCRAAMRAMALIYRQLRKGQP